MQSKGVVIGLPAFESKQVDQVCEACQLEKQHQHPFTKVLGQVGFARVGWIRKTEDRTGRVGRAEADRW